MFLRLLHTNILNVVLKKTLMHFMYVKHVSNSGKTVSSYITYSNSLYRVESSQSLCCTASIALVFQLTCSHSLLLVALSCSASLFVCVFLFAGFCLFPLRLVKMAVILNVVVECVCADAVLVVIVVILLLLLLCCYTLVVVVDTQTMRCRTTRGSTPHALRVYCLAINSLDNNFSLAS